MSSTPGASVPGASERTTETLEGVVDSTGTNSARLGSVIGDEIEVHEVRVYSDQQNFDFNVEHAGSDLFSSEQSPSGSPESFVPDQNQLEGADGADYVVDVSSAGGDSTVYVAVSVSYVPPS